MRTWLMLLGALPIAATSAQPAPPGQYVSMGSSYAAGPGVGTPEAVDTPCHRSSSNYAHLYAGRHHLQLTDVSCSGAVTDNILSRGQYGFPPQIEAVTRETTLVTILIGGNDVGYIGNLSGLSCRVTGGTKCSVMDEAEVDRRFAGLPIALDRIVAAVRRRAPSARIVFVDYLPLVPGDDRPGCTALPLSPADADRMRTVAARLTQAFAAAARNAVGVVRAAAIGDGQGACSARPLVSAFRPPRNPGWAAPVGYHPTQAGMKRVADALGAAIGAMPR